MVSNNIYDIDIENYFEKNVDRDSLSKAEAETYLREYNEIVTKYKTSIEKLKISVKENRLSLAKKYLSEAKKNLKEWMTKVDQCPNEMPVNYVKVLAGAAISGICFVNILKLLKTNSDSAVNPITNTIKEKINNLSVKEKKVITPEQQSQNAYDNGSFALGDRIQKDMASGQAKSIEYTIKRRKNDSEKMQLTNTKLYDQEYKNLGNFGLLPGQQNAIAELMAQSKQDAENAKIIANIAGLASGLLLTREGIRGNSVSDFKKSAKSAISKEMLALAKFEANIGKIVDENRELKRQEAKKVLDMLNKNKTQNQKNNAKEKIENLKSKNKDIEKNKNKEINDLKSKNKDIEKQNKKLKMELNKKETKLNKLKKK